MPRILQSETLRVKGGVSDNQAVVLEAGMSTLPLCSLVPTCQFFKEALPFIQKVVI